MRTTRPDTGGIWGTGTWGQRYYAGHIQGESYPTRPDCGGIWGTGTWGGRYFAGHIQCDYAPVPPIPPTPPTPEDSSSGGSSGKRRHIRDWTPPFKQPEIIRFNEAGDEEDLELILTLWLSLKN